MPRNELVCLALVYCHKNHAYAVNGFLKTMGLEGWAKVSRAALYNTFKRLEKSGALKGRSERVGEMPERRIYTITPAGTAQLEEECRQGLNSVDKSLFALAITFNVILSPEESLAILKKRTKILEERKSLLQEKCALTREHQLFHSEILCNAGVKDLEIQMDTTEELMDLLRKHPDYFIKKLKPFYSGEIRRMSGEI